MENDDILVISNSNHQDYVGDEEEEEEALSLCDLPINEESQSRNDQKAQSSSKVEEDFDFGSWGGSVNLTESEMCSADEVFFQGQILPFRHSVSSDNGLGVSGFHSRSLSRSESMDHLNSGGLFSTSGISSRSSSIRSHNSSSSSGTIRNRFHSHPSPSPQIRARSFRRENAGRPSPHKSTMWRFLQVGVVRTPNIELENLKLRRNTSSTSSIVSSTTKNRAKASFNGEKIKVEKKKKQLGLFGGCKCSINSVDQTVYSSRAVMIRNNSTVKVNEKEEERERGVKKTKQTTSRHRTFEWLKELSLAGVPD